MKPDTEPMPPNRPTDKKDDTQREDLIARPLSDRDTLVPPTRPQPPPQVDWLRMDSVTNMNAGLAPPPSKTASDSSPGGPASAPAALPKQIGSYEIVRELGRGGMGVVYQARQASLNRTVALKMILAQGHAGAEDLARFKTEAEAVAKLPHPNIVQIHEIGEHGGLPFFSLEFVDGGSLADRIDGEPQPPKAAAEMVRILAQAMHTAHRHGILHRDLKPANVLLTRDGMPKIADFGLAKEMDATVAYTASGVILGTPSYMAPEQAEAKNKNLGPHTDIYALGAILYEMLTGRPPFQGVTGLDTLYDVIHAEPLPPTQVQSRLPHDLEVICLKCLRKEPAKRYASAAELADDLGRYLAGEPIHARPVPKWERAWKWAERRPARAFIGVLGLAAIVRVGLWVWWDVIRFADLQHERDDAVAQARDLTQSADQQRRELIITYRQLADLRLRQDQAIAFAAVADKLQTLAANDGEVLYELARGFAQLGRSGELAAANTYGGRAIDLLQKARNAGYFKEPARVEQFNKDAVFEPLRSRADFPKSVQDQ